APQVMGASKDALDFTRRILEVEMNSATDNPLIFPGDGVCISGGNFHGQPVAMGLDIMALAISYLANMSERRISALLDPSLNNGLPAFLVGGGSEPGVSSGLMAVQYTATSLVGAGKLLTHPWSSDSIPTSRESEDRSAGCWVLSPTVIVYPIRSNLAKPGDSVPELFSNGLTENRVRLKTRDVVAVSSKIVGIAEKRIRSLENVKPGSKAKSLARKYSLTAAFDQAVLDEADMVDGGVEGALLTVKNGDAVANAGIDRKNAPEGAVVLWPRDADLSAKNIRRSIRRKSGKN